MQENVSVIIPAFNSAPFLGRAVQSALDQSHKPREVIVVDDGSQDDTAGALRRFGQSIELIRIPNGGVANARNVGMRACKGELIAFLDADDIWRQDKLARQLAALRAFPHVGFCCCNYRVVDQSSQAMVEHFAQFKHERAIVFDQPLQGSSFLALIKCNLVGTASNVLITRAVMQAAGWFDVHYRQAEDYEYWLRCARHTPLLLLSASLMDKSTHENNLTHDWLETCLCHEMVLLSLQSGHGADAETRGIARALARIRYSIAHRLYEEGAIARAFAYYGYGLRSDASPANVALFCLLTAKKLLRTASFGRLRRKRRAPPPLAS